MRPFSKTERKKEKTSLKLRKLQENYLLENGKEITVIVICNAIPGERLNTIQDRINIPAY